MRVSKFLLFAVSLSLASVSLVFASALNFQGLSDPPGVISTERGDALELLQSNQETLGHKYLSELSSIGVALDGVYKPVMVTVRYGVEFELSYTTANNGLRARHAESEVSEQFEFINRAGVGLS